MNICPCGSGKSYEECCGPILEHGQQPDTAEALMRARYMAYITNNIPFLGESLHPGHRNDWDENATRQWAENADWLGLEIRTTEGGQEGDEEGMVEFIASFKEKGVIKQHHELSRFKRKNGRWYYVDGDMPKPETVRNASGKVGRNDPCPCGSGKKYKKCCGR